jgi:hypothetical protein
LGIGKFDLRFEILDWGIRDWEIRLNPFNPDRGLVAELPCNIHPLNPLNPDRVVVAELPDLRDIR